MLRYCIIHVPGALLLRIRSRKQIEANMIAVIVLNAAFGGHLLHTCIKSRKTPPQINIG